jgi:hypothetical protein
VVVGCELERMRLVRVSQAGAARKKGDCSGLFTKGTVRDEGLKLRDHSLRGASHASAYWRQRRQQPNRSLTLDGELSINSK